MTKVFSLHEIHHRATDGGPEIITPPGQVFNLRDADVEILTRMGAVRAPTDMERKLDALASGPSPADSAALDKQPAENPVDLLG